MASVCYPRLKSCGKWLLVSDDIIPDTIIRKLGLSEFGTSKNVFSFDCDVASLKELYVVVITVFEEFGFDTSILLFEVFNSKFVY